jgi:hypothetical protein
MFSNAWNNILDWFRDRSERSKLVRSFNDSARGSFVSGIAPTLLKAKISKGESSYKHQFSNWFWDRGRTADDGSLQCPFFDQIVRIRTIK